MKIYKKSMNNVRKSMNIYEKQMKINENQWKSIKSYPRSRDPQALKRPPGRPEPRSPLQTQQTDKEM